MNVRCVTIHLERSLLFKQIERFIAFAARADSSLTKRARQRNWPKNNRPGRWKCSQAESSLCKCNFKAGAAFLCKITRTHVRTPKHLSETAAQCVERLCLRFYGLNMPINRFSLCLLILSGPERKLLHTLVRYASL